MHDPGFTGFYRVEYGLWHGQSAKELTNPVEQLAGYVQSLRKAFPNMEIDLLDIGLRTHEILENAVQFQLSGHDDYGSGTTLATTAGQHHRHQGTADDPAPAARHQVQRAARGARSG